MKNKTIIAVILSAILISVGGISLFFFYQDFEDDTTSPTVEIVHPNNKTYIDSQQQVEITASDADSEIDAIWYNWNGNNKTYTNPIDINFNEGTNTLIAWANDTNGNVGSDAVTFTIDTTAPAISIDSPSNSTYASDTITVSLSGDADEYWYYIESIDDTNQTWTEDEDRILSDGTYTLHAFGNDSIGNVGSDTVTFTIDAPKSFLSKWDTTKTDYASTNDDQVKLPLEYSGTYDFTVNWGDETTDTITTWDQEETTHTYSSSGIYTINITGTIDGWRFNSQDDNLKLIEIEQWGDLRLGNSGDYFEGCSNLNITANDVLNLEGTTKLDYAFDDCEKIENLNEWDVSHVTSMRYMFANVKEINQDINGWNVSSVTDMRGLFINTAFNQDISGWNVSSVTDMSYMFYEAAAFNQSIGEWDVSSVTDMSYMFWCAEAFNQSIGDWDVSSVTDMSNMFSSANAFNQDISGWNVSSVTDMSNMFSGAEAFNQSIGDWDVSSVTDMNYIFSWTDAFNQDISGWDVSSVTDMKNMFSYTDNFNQSIGEWDVSSVTSMSTMFRNAAAFNQDISGWDVSSVTDMNNMFNYATVFDQDISGWNVSSVTDMSYMFNGATAFSGDISGWNVSSVTNMRHVFSNNDFNPDISGWDVSSVTIMTFMFGNNDLFDQNIGNWNVSSVTDMSYMFKDADAFDQNIGNWNVSSVTDMSYMFDYTTLSTANYDSLLIGWSNLTNLQSEVSFNGGNSQYTPDSDASHARQSLIDDYSWVIEDGGEAYY